MTQQKNKRGSTVNKSTVARGRRNTNTRRNRNVSINSGNNALAHFSPITRTLAQAITNPFADSAIGACIPDAWTPPSIPALDRLSVNLDPSALAAIDPADDLTILGFFMAVVPRSLGAGWIAQRNSGTVNVPVYVPDRKSVV